MFVILRAYFDDSGTHADSDVVVMGGLIGTAGQWEDFERQWTQKLKCPLSNKPPLKRFHLSACNARKGEFASYSYAEQDAVIRDFREIIINAKLTSTASAIDRKAWDELVVGRYREVLGNPMPICFLNCVDEIVRFAEPQIHGHQISIVFDQGIYSGDLQKIVDQYTHRPPVVSITFGKVQEILALQGADIVATENYWHALRWRHDNNALPRPHLKHFLDNMLYQSRLLDREAIEMELRRRGLDGRLL
jgi:hypothetical protein